MKCNQNCLKNAGNPRDMRRFQVSNRSILYTHVPGGPPKRWTFSTVSNFCTVWWRRKAFHIISQCSFLPGVKRIFWMSPYLIFFARVQRTILIPINVTMTLRLWYTIPCTSRCIQHVYCDAIITTAGLSAVGLETLFIDLSDSAAI